MYFRRIDIPHPLDPEAEVFCAELKARMLTHPGIETRNYYDIGRRYDAVHFLLSAQRREGKRLGNDVGTKAICGAHSLPEHFAALRYSDPLDVLEIALFLEPITRTDLKQYYAPLSAKYPFWTEIAENKWEWICQDFEAIRAVYMATAEHEEGMLAAIG